MHRPCGKRSCPVCAVRASLEQLNAKLATKKSGARWHAFEVSIVERFEITDTGRAALVLDTQQLELVEPAWDDELAEMYPTEFREMRARRELEP